MLPWQQGAESTAMTTRGEVCNHGNRRRGLHPQQQRVLSAAMATRGEVYNHANTGQVLQPWQQGVGSTSMATVSMSVVEKQNKTDKQTFELKSVREKNNQQLAD